MLGPSAKVNARGPEISQSAVLGQKIVYVVAVLSCADLSICAGKQYEKEYEGARLTLVMTLPARLSQFSLLYPGT